MDFLVNLARLKQQKLGSFFINQSSSCRRSSLKFLSLWVFLAHICSASAQEAHDPNTFIQYKDVAGHRLNTTILKRLNACSDFNCEIQCKNNACCRALNYRKIRSDDGKENCELLHAIASEEPAENLQENTTYDYLQLVYPKRSFNCTCSLQCKNGGRCNESIKNCSCLPGYTGQRCENADNTTMKPDVEAKQYNTTMKPDEEARQCLEKSMLFNRKYVNDYAISPGANENMTAITVCLWEKIRETQEPHTLISYAVIGQDNEFLIEVCNDLRFALKGSRLMSNVTTKDGDWHSICLVWSSKNGQYKLYKDGKVIVNGSDLRRGEKILGEGTWVLGQDQVGGNIDIDLQMVEREMTEANIWDKELSSEEILEFSTSCQSKLRGNVISWNDFMAGVGGGAEIVDGSACCKPKV